MQAEQAEFYQNTLKDLGMYEKQFGDKVILYPW